MLPVKQASQIEADQFRAVCSKACERFIGIPTIEFAIGEEFCEGVVQMIAYRIEKRIPVGEMMLHRAAGAPCP